MERAEEQSAVGREQFRPGKPPRSVGEPPLDETRYADRFSGTIAIPAPAKSGPPLGGRQTSRISDDRMTGFVPQHPRESCQFMRPGGGFAHDMPHRNAAGHFRVGDHAAMAAPPHGFGAHDADTVLPAAVVQLF